MTTFAPRTADEATEALRWALSAREAFEVVGGGSKRALGRPVNAANVLDVSGLSGIVCYEPAELVLTARAGTPMALIESALAEQSQCLAFEPPDLSALLSDARAAISATDLDAGAAPPRVNPAASGTLGGVIASGLSGPRRFRAGAARDHVLGMTAVSGRGELFVGGGKVVKNVTGYDLPKLMAGSYGTLAVLTEITTKVLPAPEHASTVLIAGLGVPDAVRSMTGVLQSSLDVSGACHFPAGVDVPGRLGAAPVTAFRLEGFVRSVEARVQSLRSLLGSAGSLSMLEGEASLAFWRGVRDVSALVAEGVGAVWRLSVPPAEGASVVGRIERAFPDAKLFLDWGGGLIWVAAQLNADPSRAGGTSSVGAYAARMREVLGQTGGHATLIRAPALVRANVDVFQPQSAAVAAVSKRVKEQFDPARVLNPGRMYAGV